MRIAKRAARSLVRSSWRAALLIGVLTVTVALGLTMITVDGAFAKRLDEIRASVGNDVTVRAAGTFGGGFLGGGRGQAAPGTSSPSTTSPGVGNGPADGSDSVLHDADIAVVGSVPHILSVTRRVTIPYTGADLRPATPAGRGGGTGGGAAPPGQAGRGRGFSLPILVTGTDDPSRLTTLGLAEAATVTKGRTFDSSEARSDVALVGAGLASANGLDVGGSLALQGEQITIVGLFETQTRFGDNSIFLPLETARRLFQRGDEVDEATARADDAANVDAAAGSLRDRLGDRVDVVTQAGIVSAITSPLASAQDSSRTGTIVALAASAALILFSVGLVLRQRVREVGVLKAVGGSNGQVIGQFAIETAMLSLVAAVLGALVTFPLAQRVANGLLSSPAAPGSAAPRGAGGRGGFGAAGAGRVAARAGGFLGNVRVAVSPVVFVYAFAIAAGLALLATLIPTWYVSRVRPAEVLRND